jgi:hypothetical protein
MSHMALELTPEQAFAEGCLATSTAWAQRLRIACETLTHTREDMMSAISLSAELDCARCTMLVRAMSRRLAEHYHLVEEVTLEGSTCTVRFARPALTIVKKDEETK